MFKLKWKVCKQETWCDGGKFQVKQFILGNSFSRTSCFSEMYFSFWRFVAQQWRNWLWFLWILSRGTGPASTASSHPGQTICGWYGQWITMGGNTFTKMCTSCHQKISVSPVQKIYHTPPSYFVWSPQACAQTHVAVTFAALNPTRRYNRSYSSSFKHSKHYAECIIQTLYRIYRMRSPWL